MRFDWYCRTLAAGLLLGGLMTPLGADSGRSQEPVSCADLTGSWRTNLGALVNLRAVDSDTGRLEGSYQPASLPDRQFPLTGFVNAAREPGDRHDGHYAVALSFSVSFLEFGGITNWTGVCLEVEGAVRLETEDLVVRPVAEGSWAHVIASHDTLTRLPEVPPATAEAQPEADSTDSDP